MQDTGCIRRLTDRMQGCLDCRVELAENCEMAQITRLSNFDTGCRIQDTRCKMQGTFDCRVEMVETYEMLPNTRLSNYDEVADKMQVNPATDVYKKEIMACI